MNIMGAEVKIDVIITSNQGWFDVRSDAPRRSVCI